MTKYLFLMLILVFIGFSCEEDKPIKEDCTISNCNGHQECSDNECVLLENRCNKNTDCVPGFECNIQNFCINPVNYCDSISCSNAGNCTIENDAPKCVCDSGYHARALECILDDPCSLVSCQENSICVVEGDKGVCHCEGGYHDEGGICVIDDNNPCKLKDCQDGASCNVKEGKAVCECNENYHADGEACLNNQKLINCDSTSIPENSTAIVKEIEINWNTQTNSWEEVPKCEWKCDNNFHLDNQICISNSKMVNCNTDNIPENSTATEVEVEVTWNLDTESWNTPIDCEWSCNEGTHEGNNLCILNLQKIDCSVDNIPENAIAEVVEVDITWNNDTNSWSIPADCEWSCVTNYHKENNGCFVNTKSVNCKDVAPDNAISTTIEVSINWNSETNSWEDPIDCQWVCKQNYTREDNQCITTSQMVNCNDNAPENAISTIVEVSVNWNSETNSWEEPSDCEWSCVNNFHTEDNSSCISNTKQVNCVPPSDIPDNATADIVEVSINWNSQTNSWEEPIECSWSCTSPFIKDGDTCIEVSCADTITLENNNFDKDNAYLLELTDSVTEFNDLNSSNMIDGVCSRQDDWYKVSLSAGDKIIVDLFFIDDDGDIDLSFYLGASTSVAYSGSVTDNESASYTIKATDIPDGQNSVDLYIKVYSFSSEGNDYKMVVKVGESCTTNDNCTSGSYCNFGQCNYDLGVNTCNDDSILTINSSGLFGGTTEDETNSYNLGSGGCTDYTEDGNDSVYKIYLNSQDQLNLTLHKTSTESKDISLYILTDCSNDVASCVAGADDTFSNDDETLSYTATTSGFYYIIVDAFDDGFYEYELNVELN